MTRRLLVISCLTAILIAPAAARADRTATYVAGYIQWNVPTTDVGIGGYGFEPGAKPTAVKVEDLNGPGVPILVCQDLDENSICGDGSEPLLRDCSRDGFVTLPTDFRANEITRVFVLVADATLECEVTPTSGTITLKP